MPLVAENFYGVVIFICHEVIIPIEHSVINYRLIGRPARTRTWKRTFGEFHDTVSSQAYHLDYISCERKT